MRELPEFVQVVDEYKDVADFITIYTEEAHPLDAWSVPNNPYGIMTHKTLEDRLEAAAMLAEKNLPCPLVVDTMTNEAALDYGTLPERLYIILDGKIVYAGGRDPWNYKPSEVKEWLKQHFRKSE